MHFPEKLLNPRHLELGTLSKNKKLKHVIAYASMHLHIIWAALSRLGPRAPASRQNGLFEPHSERYCEAALKMSPVSHDEALKLLIHSFSTEIGMAW